MHEVTTTVQIVLPQHCNGAAIPRLFGGQLMAWIDVVAAVAAQRYAHCTVTTACVDNLSFLAPAYLNDMVVQEARVTWSGNTSLEVRVDTYVERLDHSREAVNRAYLVFVALDSSGKPTPVPHFEPDTDEERMEFYAAAQRRTRRLER